MLTEIYIQTLLVDEELVDQVWEAWDAGLIPDELAALAWLCIVTFGQRTGCSREGVSRVV